MGDYATASLASAAILMPDANFGDSGGHDESIRISGPLPGVSFAVTSRRSKMQFLAESFTSCRQPWELMR